MTPENRVGLIFFSSVIAFAVLMLWLIGCAWGADGPWRVLVTDNHYEIYNVQRDTVSVTDFTLEELYYRKSVALDMAEALNEAHDRRTQKYCIATSSITEECKLAPPSLFFTHSFAAKSEQERLEDWLKKNGAEEIFIHPNPQVNKLKDHFWERVPFTWRGNQIWIRRKPKGIMSISA